MQPKIKVVTKTDAFQFLWLKNVTDFDPRKHCCECLIGKRSDVVATNAGRKYPAGFTAEGIIEEPSPYAYLCGVVPSALGIEPNVHILMEPDENSEITYEDENIQVVVSGMRRIPIQALPKEVHEKLPDGYSRCRNFQAGWQLFPESRETLSVP